MTIGVRVSVVTGTWRWGTVGVVGVRTARWGVVVHWRATSTRRGRARVGVAASAAIVVLARGRASAAVMIIASWAVATWRWPSAAVIVVVGWGRASIAAAAWSRRAGPVTVAWRGHARDLRLGLQSMYQYRAMTVERQAGWFNVHQKHILQLRP